MKYAVLARRAIGIGLGISVLAAGSSQAAASTAPAVDTSACASPLLTQPFASANDNNWYTLVPGESPGSFDGSNWQLSGGARIITTKLADGTTSSVLDLPSGAKAVSPTMCITSDYPTARTMVKDVVGSEGVFFYVSYEGTNTWDTPKNTGQVHGNNTAWTLSGSVNVQPNGTSGWQPVRFTLIGGGKTSDFQVYNLYIDPSMRK
jgi:hypothetical protein